MKGHRQEMAVMLQEGMNTAITYYKDSKFPTKKQAGIVWNEIVALALFEFGSSKFLALRSFRFALKLVCGLFAHHLLR